MMDYLEYKEAYLSFMERLDNAGFAKEDVILWRTDPITRQLIKHLQSLIDGLVVDIINCELDDKTILLKGGARALTHVLNDISDGK